MATPATTIEIKETVGVQDISVSKDFGKIICPCRILVSGPTMSGKSTFALELIKHRNLIFNVTFSRIIYALPEDSLHLHENFIKRLETFFPAIEIVEGLPKIADLNLKDDKDHKILIMDDLMSTVFNSQTMMDLVTKDSHHCNCSVVITCQNFFYPSKFGRTFVRNCSEKVIFFDKTDAKQLSILSMQIFPGKPNFLKQCFDWIYKEEPHSPLKYILIDSSVLSHFPHNAIVRTAIFPQKEGDISSIRPVLFFPHDE